MSFYELNEKILTFAVFVGSVVEAVAVIGIYQQFHCLLPCFFKCSGKIFRL